MKACAIQLENKTLGNKSQKYVNSIIKMVINIYNNI